MEQHSVIFEARKTQLHVQEKHATSDYASRISKSIGVGIFAASFILFGIFFFSFTSAKKVSAIEPTPNEHTDTLALENNASVSAKEQPQPQIMETPQPSPTVSFPVVPQPQEQTTSSITLTPTPSSEAVSAATTSTLQQPLASYRSISTYFSSYHPGVDLTDPTGTPVMAAAGGIVTHAGWSSDGYGMSVVIDHENGMKTRYAHLSFISVSLGQTVSASQVIGGVGCTGNCTGSHLHFEVIVGGIAQNPFAYLPH